MKTILNVKNYQVLDIINVCTVPKKRVKKEENFILSL